MATKTIWQKFASKENIAFLLREINKYLKDQHGLGIDFNQHQLLLQNMGNVFQDLRDTPTMRVRTDPAMLKFLNNRVLGEIIPEIDVSAHAYKAYKKTWGTYGVTQGHRHFPCSNMVTSVKGSLTGCADPVWRIPHEVCCDTQKFYADRCLFSDRINQDIVPNWQEIRDPKVSGQIIPLARDDHLCIPQKLPRSSLNRKLFWPHNVQP